jgi:hypothetical protein
MHARSSRRTLNRWENQWARSFVVVACICSALAVGYAIFRMIEKGKITEKPREIPELVSAFRPEDGEKKEKPNIKICDTIAANAVPDCVAICDYDTSNAVPDCISGQCQWPAVLDDGLPDCASANLSPELANAALRVAPNTAEYQVNLSSWLVKNRFLKDRDQSMPLLMSSVRVLTGATTQTGDQQLVSFAGGSTVLFSPTTGIVTVRPSMGEVGDTRFVMVAVDAFGAVSNEAQLTISLGCGAHEQWNGEAKHCEQLLDAETMRRLSSQNCSEQILVFGAATACEIPLEPNTWYAPPVGIDARIEGLAGSQGQCAVVDPGMVSIPLAWRQSLMCGPLSLSSIAQRGYFSGSASVSVGGVHRVFGMAGRVGSCPAGSEYQSGEKGGFCQCTDKQTTLDIHTKTCQPTRPVPPSAPEIPEQKSITPPVPEAAPAAAQSVVCDPPSYKNNQNKCVECPVNAVVSAIGVCVSCAVGEFTSVDRSSCVVCDAKPANGIPDCLSDCSFGDEPGKNACGVAQECDRINTPQTRDNGLPQCPEPPACNTHPHDGVPDCAKPSDSCDIIDDNGVEDCPRDALSTLLVPDLLEISPGDTAMLVQALPGYISVGLSGLPQHGVLSLTKQVGYTHNGTSEMGETVEMLFSDRYGKTRMHRTTIGVACPVGTAWNYALHQCGQVLHPVDLGECQIQDFAGTLGCRLRVVDALGQSLYTLPTPGFHVILETEDGDKNSSNPCTIELNMSDAAAVVCLFPVHLVSRPVQVWIQQAESVTRKNPILISALTPHSVPACDAIGGNTVPDCTLYCNAVLGDYIPDCSPEQCDFEFDNGVADCPVDLVFRIHTPLQPPVLAPLLFDSYVPASGAAAAILIVLALRAPRPKKSVICTKKTTVLYW